MKALLAGAAAVGWMLTIGYAQTPAPARAARPAPAATSATSAAFDANGVVKTYCSGCHNEGLKSGNLSLAKFDATAAHKDAETAEKMIRKLRAGMMPPPGSRRPDGDALTTLVEKLEKSVDAAAALNPNPGGRTFQRLNRPEYKLAIRDLLGLDVDVTKWLPLDQMSNNFDNMADAQTLSPTLLEAYLNAATSISRMAVGDRNAPAIDETYTNSQFV